MANHSEDLTDPLEVLGHEIRIAVLRELADADGALSFTQLRERVGVRDTGKFNYHLTKLCSYFVREVEAGYELGHAGSRVIAAADPGAGSGQRSSFDSESTTDTDSTAAESEIDVCPVCGEENCEKVFHVHLTPPWA